MKKILFISAAFCIAERASAQLSIAPEAGFQMVKMSHRGPDKNQVLQFLRQDYRASFRAGVNISADLKNISIHSGVFYDAKGSKAPYFSKLNLGYISIPFYVNYNIINRRGSKLFAGVGPYINYCLGGKYTFNPSAEPGPVIYEEKNIVVGTGIKPIDLGASANLGLVSSFGVYVRMYYTIGLTNTLPDASAQNAMNHTSFGVSMGYQIGLNKKNKVPATTN